MRLLKILSLLSIAGILLLSFFTWYSGDDFCYRNELARYSVFKMAWLQYLYWDGRSITVAAFVQLLSLKYFPIEITALIWSASFVGTSFFVYKILQLENPALSENKNQVTMVAIISAVMWLGMWKFIPDIIYWATGGSYSLLNLLGMCWVYVFLLGLKSSRFNLRGRILILVVSLVCGINSHNLITGLLAFCLVELGFHWFVRKDRFASAYILYSLVGLLIGACIVFFAPGNQVRLRTISYHGFGSQFIYFYFLVLIKYSYWLIGLIALCFAVTWLSGKKIIFQGRDFVSHVKTTIQSVRKEHSVFIILHNHKYAVAALATIAMFSATAFFAVPRTSIFFATFMVISIFKFGWKSEEGVITKRFIYGCTALLGVFILIVSCQLMKAYEIKQVVGLREQLYFQNKGTDVVIPPIPSSAVPFAFSFIDVSSDSSYWVNRCVAQHYQLKTVRTASE